MKKGSLIPPSSPNRSVCVTRQTVRWGWLFLGIVRGLIRPRDRGARADQAVRQDRRRRRPQLRRRARPGHRVPRAERVWQEHDDAVHARSRPVRAGFGDVRRQAVRRAHQAAARGRQPARRRLRAPRPDGAQPLALARRVERDPAWARRGGPATRRSDRRRQAAGQGVLARDAPTARSWPA